MLITMKDCNAFAKSGNNKSNHMIWAFIHGDVDFRNVHHIFAWLYIYQGIPVILSGNCYLRSVQKNKK